MDSLRLSYRAVGLGLLLLATSAGCGGGEKPIPRYPVSGSVKFQGTPLDGGTITFFRQEGGGSSGTIDATGLYIVSGGLQEGQYRVYIEPPPDVMTPPPMGGPPMNIPKKEHKNIPQKYRQAATSGLMATIEPKKSGNSIEFDMK